MTIYWSASSTTNSKYIRSKTSQKLRVQKPRSERKKNLGKKRECGVHFHQWPPPPPPPPPSSFRSIASVSLHTRFYTMGEHVKLQNRHHNSFSEIKAYLRIFHRNCHLCNLRHIRGRCTGTRNEVPRTSLHICRHSSLRFVEAHCIVGDAQTKFIIHVL